MWMWNGKDAGSVLRVGICLWCGFFRVYSGSWRQAHQEHKTVETGNGEKGRRWHDGKRRRKGNNKKKNERKKKEEQKMSSTELSLVWVTRLHPLRAEGTKKGHPRSQEK